LAWKTAGTPAFSFNTTVAETGDRFLSANYAVPRQGDKNSELTPADSFLQVYHRDLPLSSAARLSANFPYVSPMPKVPVPDSHFHFGDGGYFDNDGTSSALEFLHHAHLDRNAATQLVPVLLLEIRDSGDFDASFDPDDLKAQANGQDWGGTGQLVGPLLTFWNANHVSVTRRNRRELCFLEQALQDQAAIKHLVFDYQSGTNDKQPLSWHLTEQQKKTIQNAVASDRITQKANQAVAWYQQALGGQQAKPQKVDCSRM
jgi:hypothetical protein